ncbi:MAG: response regulator [Candidatus Zixiibacteriota bacterium]
MMSEDKNIKYLAPEPNGGLDQVIKTRQTPLRILIVDDDKEVIETLSKVLEVIDAATEIKSSLTGGGALKLLEFNVFDLIILDVNLPDLDGGDILRFIRTQAKNKSASIIAISGVPHVLDSMLQMGADVCLPKPFRIQELNEIIRGLLKL